MKLLNIKVKPNSPETKITQAEPSSAVPRGTRGSTLVSRSGDELVVAVAAPAENNKNSLSFRIAFA